MTHTNFKKILPIVTILLASIHSLYAQKEGIRFGVQVGVNASDVFNEDIDAIKTGYTASAILEIPLISQKLSIQPEVTFSTIKNAVTTTDEQTNINLNYVNIPIVFKYYPFKAISLQAGTQLGKLIEATQEIKNNDEDSNIVSRLKDIDFGFNFGVGYELKSGIFLVARYNAGSLNINDGFSTEAIKNSISQLTIGYKF